MWRPSRHTPAIGGLMKMSDSKLGRQCCEPGGGLDRKWGGVGAQPRMHTYLHKHSDRSILTPSPRGDNEHIFSSASLKHCNGKDKRERYVVPVETMKTLHTKAINGCFTETVKCTQLMGRYTVTDLTVGFLCSGLNPLDHTQHCC